MITFSLVSFILSDDLRFSGLTQQRTRARMHSLKILILGDLFFTPSVREKMGAARRVKNSCEKEDTNKARLERVAAETHPFPPHRAQTSHVKD
ncbi:hypothetical protein FKM82_021974 [Ascaphus truei]